MKKIYYTASSLEEDISEFEERYALTSREFFEAYAGDSGQLEGISAHDRIAWASLYGALCRVHEASPSAALHPAT